MSAVDQPTVLVTDAERGSALAIIRSLGRKGWRVIAAASEPRSLGFSSRFCHAHFVYSPPATAPEKLVDELYQKAREFGVDLIIPVTDEVIHPLALERSRFEGVCGLAIAVDEALAIATDKDRTMALAESIGVPVPRTEIVLSDQDASKPLGQMAPSLQFPVVLKPAVSRDYRPDEGITETNTVSYAVNEDELSAQLIQLPPDTKVLLQEYCEGAGCGVELLAYRGRPLAAFQHLRLAEFPVTGGASAWRESTELDPELYDYATRLIAALGWTGLLMVEFKVGARSTLMEINGRIWGSLPLATISGMDFPGKLAVMYLEPPEEQPKEPTQEPLEADTRYRVGQRAFNLELIVKWILVVLVGRRRYTFPPTPRRREIPRVLLGILSPWQRFDVTAWDDPMPSFAEVGKIVRRLVGKMR